MKKKKSRYIVFIQDEWNNLWWMGEYRKLSDAVPDINGFFRGLWSAD